jgi:hypothetical protein
MAEPARLRRVMIRLKAATAAGFDGAPTSVIEPSSLRSWIYALRS